MSFVIDTEVTLMSNSDNDWWKKIPVPTLCQWELMKKILEGRKDLTIYKLTQYAEQFDVCKDEEKAITRHKVEVILEKWQRHGLVKIVDRYSDKGPKDILVTSKCIEYAKRVRYWYEGYIT